jgi:NAD(P)-dependent dehydrogenase (short-subunit alcohol dehydrogenase family)
VLISDDRLISDPLPRLSSGEDSMSKMSNLSDKKVAIVTGASGGIGLATATALEWAGYTVFGTGRRATFGSTVNGVRMVPCDVTSNTSVTEAVFHILREAGRVDLLVNNAGVGLMGAAEESSIEQVHQVFDTNVYGLIRMTNAVLPIMRRQRSGRIINLSSILGVIPAPFSAHYGAAKHAVEGYSESLDHEVRSMGIRVVLVEPGMTQTDFEQNTAKPERAIADYDDGRTSAQRWFADGMKVADLPDNIAKTILLAAQAEKPKPRYTAGKGTGKIALLRRLVPSDAFAKSLRQQMHLP